MRYFSVDDTKTSSNSFVTSCETEEDVDSLMEGCSDCHIKEISHQEYLSFTHEAS